MSDSKQDSLFAPCIEDAPAEMSDAALLADACDAAAILSMGPDEGLAAFSLMPLRRQLLDAVSELARRWGMDVSA